MWEVADDISRTHQLIQSLIRSVAAEEVAGIPAAPGSAQARYAAAVEHLARLRNEEMAILTHCACCPVPAVLLLQASAVDITSDAPLRA